MQKANIFHFSQKKKEKKNAFKERFCLQTTLEVTKPVSVESKTVLYRFLNINIVLLLTLQKLF